MSPLTAKPTAAVRVGAGAVGYSQREALDLASDLGWPEPAVYRVAPVAPRGMLAELLRGADLSTAAGRLVVRLLWETRLHDARRKVAMRAHGSGRPA